MHSSYSSASTVAPSLTCSWSLSSAGFISAAMRWHGFCQDQEHALASWAAGVLCEHSGPGWGCLHCPGRGNWLVVNLCRGPYLLCSDFTRRCQGHPTVCLGFVELLLSKGALITGYQSEQRSPGNPVTPGTEPGGCARHFGENTQVF